MNENFDNFNARLLDASLKEYSRVTPPADLASRLLATKNVAPRAWFGWLWIPAAAALACGIVMMRPVPPAPAPLGVHRAPVVQLARPVLATAVKKPSRTQRKPPFHVLTGAELASMTLPPELFATREEKPIDDIVITPLTVTPLEIPTIPDPEGVKQQ
jgi:hypothetical protein